ncbi:CbiX/SirB N-terminal domain-containing protein [Leifsonia shinshuensis]|uniref:sirohydrochlorin chelatase n=1 Tax=Leifsonia shinshuensis TaxID=150026 RepID=UPI0028626308|nr:CbiX/SirB N-terminal domain-containing protein [Leifsonia shinshuensis]MDR6972064.1 sirohydrochlorin ferrochelatase [Leifsonia shinshuensis]
MTTAVIAASHGTSSPAGQAAVRRLVEAVDAAVASPVLGCHVDVEQPDVPSALSAAAGLADRATIVPLLLSAGYHVFVDLAESAAAAALPTTVTGALGPDDRLVEVLLRRLQEAGLRDTDAVVLAAAGSSDARAVTDCRTMARLLASRIGRPVTAGFISAAAPDLSTAVSMARAGNPGARVVVATYLLAPGYFASLARTAGADMVTEPLVTAESTPAELVEVVVDRLLTGLSGAVTGSAGRRSRP